MKENIGKRTGRLGLLVALVLGVVMLIPTPAWATSVAKRSLSKFKGTVTLYMGDDLVIPLGSKNVTNFNSSNFNVVAGYIDSGHYDITKGKSIEAVVLTPHRTGSAKVTIWVGSKTYTAKVKVKKRAVVAKKAVVCGMTYTSKSRYTQAGSSIDPKASLRNGGAFGKEYGKVKITPAKGWKVKAIYYSNRYRSGKVRKLSNGKKVPKKYGASEITVVMQNKKNKGIQTLHYGFD